MLIGYMDGTSNIKAVYQPKVQNGEEKNIPKAPEGFAFKVYANGLRQTRGVGDVKDWSDMTSVIEKEGVKVIISTSKCDKGVDSNYRIDKVFGDFRGSGGPDSRTLGQMLVRFRKPLSTIIFICCALLENRAPKLYVDVLREMRANQAQVINKF